MNDWPAGRGLHIGQQEDMFTPDQDRKEPQMRKKFANYPSLSGKTVFVTGGASGIGAEIVTAFAKQGAKVGFVDMDIAGSEALLAKLEGTHSFAPCDLRDIDALKAAFAQLAETLGPAEILVNNAARDDRHDWREVTPEYWDERQNNNLRHMFFAIQAVADGMIAGGGGSIINMGSNSWWEAGWRLSGLYHRQSGRAWADSHHGARSGRSSHSCQYSGARLDYDRAAKTALGHSRSPSPSKSTANACPIPSILYMSPEWCFFSPPTILRPVRRKTLWSKAVQSRARPAIFPPSDQRGLRAEQSHDAVFPRS
jgi:NAD(P)-dependent dehydrogenase (short-subunit alcohol dehydrogenase family)